MNTKMNPPKIYDGEGDQLMVDRELAERVILLPDKRPTKTPDPTPRLRIM